jgi:hypothetical protein
MTGQHLLVVKRSSFRVQALIAEQQRTAFEAGTAIRSATALE